MTRYDETIYKDLKKRFTDVVKCIDQNRPVSTNKEKLDEYEQKLIETYNEFVNYCSSIHENLTDTSRRVVNELLVSFKNKLKFCFEKIERTVNISEDLFALATSDNSNLSNIQENFETADIASNFSPEQQNFEVLKTDLVQQIVTFLEESATESIENIIANVELFTNSYNTLVDSSENSENFDSSFKFYAAGELGLVKSKILLLFTKFQIENQVPHEVKAKIVLDKNLLRIKLEEQEDIAKRLATNRDNLQNLTSSNTLSGNNSKNNMAEKNMQYIASAAKTVNTYSGEPLGLATFINSVELLKLATSAEQEDIF